MISYVIIWYDIKWFHVTWYHIMTHDIICDDIICYDIIWYDIIWYDIIWYDIIWYDSRGWRRGWNMWNEWKTNFFQENFPENYIIKKNVFCVFKNMFYEKSSFWFKHTIRLLLGHHFEYLHIKLHRIAFSMLKTDSTMLNLWPFLFLT